MNPSNRNYHSTDNNQTQTHPIKTKHPSTSINQQTSLTPNTQQPPWTIINTHPRQLNGDLPLKLRICTSVRIIESMMTVVWMHCANNNDVANHSDAIMPVIVLIVCI